MDRELFIQKIYAESYEPLRRYAKYICKDKEMTEDVLQETYFEAFLQQNVLENHENIRAWLFQTVTYKAYNYNRKYMREEVWARIEDAGCWEKSYSETEWLVTLEEILGKEDARTVWQYYAQGHAGKCIADRLGITESNLNVKMHRLKKKIREDIFGREKRD